MQRILSASCKDQKVPFSQNGLAIPEKDKLRMRIDSLENVSYSWEQTLQIVEQIKTMDTLGAARREQGRDDQRDHERKSQAIRRCS